MSDRKEQLRQSSINYRLRKKMKIIDLEEQLKFCGFKIAQLENQLSETIAQNGELIRQNSELIKQNTELVSQLQEKQVDITFDTSGYIVSE